MNAKIWHTVYLQFFRLSFIWISLIFKSNNQYILLITCHCSWGYSNLSSIDRQLDILTFVRRTKPLDLCSTLCKCELLEALGLLIAFYRSICLFSSHIQSAGCSSLNCYSNWVNKVKQKLIKSIIKCYRSSQSFVSFGTFR